MPKQECESQTTPEETKSEFGEGYAYCLGLFLAHEMRIWDYKEKNEKMGKGDILNASLWFNGAADHLYGLKAPASFSEEEKKEVEDFRLKCLQFRLCMNGEQCDWQDATEACDQAKAMLLAWDKRNGIDAIKGDWQ